MSAITNRIGRRLSLLAGSSLAAAWLVAGAGALSLAPTAAFAADECGDPDSNATTTDTFTCVGTFAAITYPDTNGALTLNLLNNVTTTTGGLVVTVTPLATTAVNISRSADSPANSGDPSLTSTSTTTAALQVTRNAGGTIGVNLTDNDTTDAPLVISGVNAGVRLQNAGTGSTTFTTTNGAITASAGTGIELAAGTGSITVTNGSAVTGSTAAIAVTAGLNATVTNSASGVLNGALSFVNTGTTAITNNGEWNAAGASTLGLGTTTLTNTVTGLITTAGAAVDFAAGTDTFANAGMLAVEGTLTFTGLEAWNNSGTVLFGSSADRDGSDGASDDRIASTGTFTGSTFSRMDMDVDFSASQLSCAAAINADCLDLRGGGTSGSTSVIVNTIARGFGSERIVLVDVAGAGTDAGTFTLAENSPGYIDLDGGVIDGGLFLYALQHDTAAKQHVLTAVSADGEAFELALVGRQASEPWRTATGMWHDRQADLRNTLAGHTEGYAPGVWLKVAGSFIDEGRVDALSVGDDTLEFTTSYAQDTTAIVGGVDLLRFIGDNSAWVLGLTAGKVDSTVDFSVGQSVVELEGHSFGAYASVLRGRAFFDAIINSTNLDLAQSGFGAEVEGAAKSIGYQLEGGYRLFQINDDGAWLEPLASLSYVSTDVDELAFADTTTFSVEDTSSLRYALGLRLGGDMVMDALTASFSATGRVWKQSGGDSNSVLSAAFGDTELTDDGIDNLGDLGVAVSLFTLGGRLSAHLAYNVLFQDDYQNTGASFGLRYNW